MFGLKWGGHLPHGMSVLIADRPDTLAAVCTAKRCKLTLHIVQHGGKFTGKENILGTVSISLQGKRAFNTMANHVEDKVVRYFRVIGYLVQCCLQI